MEIGTTATAATKILADALKLLNSLREQAQRTKDASLKAGLLEIYDHLLNLREIQIRLIEENAELNHGAKAPVPEIRQVGAANFYFLGDKGPYCQPCYDKEGKLRLLSPPEEWSDGIRRKCESCRRYFYEKPTDSSPYFTIA
jgi:hypothetical protein